MTLLIHSTQRKNQAHLCQPDSGIPPRESKGYEESWGSWVHTEAEPVQS